MPMNAFFDGVDNFTRSGKYFVALTQRLGDGKVVAGEDATLLGHAFGISVPPELEGASIETMEDSNVAGEAIERGAEGAPLRVVVIYPPESTSDTAEFKINKCFKVCQTVAGAKVCAEVCVNIHAGLSGVGGSVSATVSASF
jgi:hypothetical protein